MQSSAPSKLNPVCPHVAEYWFIGCTLLFLTQLRTGFYIEHLGIYSIFHPLETLENSKKFQDGRNVCHQLKDCIEEGNTSLELTNILHDQKVEVSELCAAVLRKCDSRQYFEDMICALMQAEKDCAENIQLLKSLIDYVKKLSNKLGYHIDGIETVVRRRVKIWTKPGANEKSMNYRMTLFGVNYIHS